MKTVSYTVELTHNDGTFQKSGDSYPTAKEAVIAIREVIFFDKLKGGASIFSWEIKEHVQTLSLSLIHI